ncbi:LysR substrate-binding domain-containing protein, partial [Rhizobium phaseoli]
SHFFESLQVDGTPSQAMRFEQFSSVAQACIAGLGLALMPVFLIDSELANGQLVQALPHQVKSPSAYYAVAPLSRKDFRPVVAFRAWLLEEVALYRKNAAG